ncbi:MAG: HipA domain-containing protein [Natronospirillum sp.]
MTQQLYVWTRSLHPEGLPIIAGHLQITQGIGEFIYGRSYLSRPNAFALDPINLPLQTDSRIISTLNGIPGVLMDAGPDAWGRRVVSDLTGKTQDTDILLHGNGYGVGSLMFSEAPDVRPKQHQRTTVTSLTDLELALAKFQAGQIQDLTPAERMLLDQGSSIGGARPKLAIQYQAKEWIAKFNRPSDRFNHALVEHATMTLAKKAGIDVAASHVERIHDEWVYLTQRFDRRKGFSHYLSVASLFNVSRLSPNAFLNDYSYAGIAQLIGRMADQVQVQREELFRRMIFNILMHNTDDHSKNHGFLMQSPEEYALTPAFDLLPHLGSHQHALGIGTHGRSGNLQNAMSRANEFGLSNPAAKMLAEGVLDVVQGWGEHFSAQGVVPEDIATLRPYILQQEAIRF